MNTLELAELLEKRIKSVESELDTLVVGTEEYSAATEELAKLVKAREDLLNGAMDRGNSTVQPKKDRITKIAISVAEFIGLAGVTIWATMYENDGGNTGPAFRNFGNALKLRLKK